MHPDALILNSRGECLARFGPESPLAEVGVGWSRRRDVAIDSDGLIAEADTLESTISSCALLIFVIIHRIVLTVGCCEGLVVHDDIIDISEEIIFKTVGVLTVDYNYKTMDVNTTCPFDGEDGIYPLVRLYLLCRELPELLCISTLTGPSVRFRVR